MDINILCIIVVTALVRQCRKTKQSLIKKLPPSDEKFPYKGKCYEMTKGLPFSQKKMAAMKPQTEGKKTLELKQPCFKKV